MSTRRERQRESRALLDEVATVENARRWYATREKWLFVTNLLMVCEATEGSDFTDWIVNNLENRFLSLLS